MTVDVEWGQAFTRALLEWYGANGRSFPWREEDATLYEVFMSEMFLRRTRADVVESFLPRFLERYPDIESLSEAEIDELAEVIRPMGLQNTRARGLVELASELDGDELPRDPDSLRELPQVGPYVANATLCFAEDERLPIVDRNVERVYGRLFGDWWAELSETERWDLAGELLPEGEARSYNLGLLDFAADVCTATSPDCDRCIVSGYCSYYRAQGPESES